MRNSNVTQVDLQTNYANWLNSYQWDYFCTLTTRYELTVKSARRAGEGFYNHLNVIDNGNNPERKRCRFFWGAEPFEVKDGYHIHGLLKVHDDMWFTDIVHTWQYVTGNKLMNKAKWNRVDLQKFDPKRGAGFYCSKYILKGLSDWDLHV